MSSMCMNKEHQCNESTLLETCCLGHCELKSKRLIKKLEKMSFHAVIPLSLGSNLPQVYKNDNPNFRKTF